MQIAAEYFAKKRMLYEYPRVGYSEYNETHLTNIVSGYIGEFCFLEYVHNYLEEKFGNLEPTERYNKVKDFLVYKMIIGQIQPDWDFKIAGRTVEVKTYGTKILNRVEQVFDYNLLIDVDQVKNKNIPNFYVQCFLLKNENFFLKKGKKLYCILAGYHEGLPKKICKNLPKPAYCVPVKELNPIKGLLSLIM